MTILLAIASIILAVNGLLTMYKCMCSRNYARWRSSWQHKHRVHRRHHGDSYYTEFRETVPLVMSGHKQVTPALRPCVLLTYMCADQVLFSMILYEHENVQLNLVVRFIAS